MRTLLQIVYPNADLCYGANRAPSPLDLPYVNEQEMDFIETGYSSAYSTSAWDFPHEGFDIYPTGDLKEFKAACAGTIDKVQLAQPTPGANWQVTVLVKCKDYVFDPDAGDYFIPFSAEYIFETMSNLLVDGQNQLSNIYFAQGDPVTQGEIIGRLNVFSGESHLHFGLVQYGSSVFTIPGIEPIPLCPTPHYAAADNDSFLKLLNVAWPTANLCYQE